MARTRDGSCPCDPDELEAVLALTDQEMYAAMVCMDFEDFFEPESGKLDPDPLAFHEFCEVYALKPAEGRAEIVREIESGFRGFVSEIRDAKRHGQVDAERRALQLDERWQDVLRQVYPSVYSLWSQNLPKPKKRWGRRGPASDPMSFLFSNFVKYRMGWPSHTKFVQAPRGKRRDRFFGSDFGPPYNLIPKIAKRY